MNRNNLLFRAKSKLNGSWVLGDIVINRTTEDWDYIVYCNDVITEINPIRVISRTIGQYTGLTDSNNQKIFEGDILEFENDDRFCIGREDYGLCFFVDWIGDPENEDQARDFYRIERATIIGNKFDNPNLLNNDN